MAVVALIPYRERMSWTGREPLLLLLAAFLITFACTRGYTRIARVRGWGSAHVDGIHLHHMVVGIVLILVSGLVEFSARPVSPGRELLAIVFGVGAAMTLDEFALWLYLRDVYWSPQGRSSIDATLMGLVLSALLLVGTSPFGVPDDSRLPRAIVFGLIAGNVLFALATFMKGKLTLGLISVFVPFVGLAGAVRLAKPNSLWAKRFYNTHPEKVARGKERYEDPNAPLVRLRDWFDDLVGGSPTPAAPAGLHVADGRLKPTAPPPR